MFDGPAFFCRRTECLRRAVTGAEAQMGSAPEQSFLKIGEKVFCPIAVPALAKLGY